MQKHMKLSRFLLLSTIVLDDLRKILSHYKNFESNFINFSYFSFINAKSQGIIEGRTTIKVPLLSKAKKPVNELATLSLMPRNLVDNL